MLANSRLLVFLTTHLSLSTCAILCAEDSALLDRRKYFEAISVIANGKVNDKIKIEQIDDAKRQLAEVPISQRPLLKKIHKLFKDEQLLTTRSEEVEQLILLELDDAGRKLSADTLSKLGAMGLDTLFGGNPNAMEYSRSLLDPAFADVASLIDLHILSVYMKTEAARVRREFCSALRDSPGRAREIEILKPCTASIKYHAKSDSAVVLLRNTTQETLQDFMAIIDMPCTCQLSAQSRIADVLIPGLMDVFGFESSEALSKGYLQRDEATAVMFDEDKAAFVFSRELKPNEILSCSAAMAPALMFAERMAIEVSYTTDQPHLVSIPLEVAPIKKEFASEASAEMRRRQSAAIKAAKAKSRAKR